MKIKNLNVGDKYLMSVHGLVVIDKDKEKDPTLSAETLEVISIDGEKCIAKGCVSECTYSMTVNEYKSRSLKKSINGYHQNPDISDNKISDSLYLVFVVFILIIFAIKIIVDLNNTI